MTKKLLSAALVLSTLFLAACGSSDPQISTAESTATHTTEASETSAPVQTEGSTLASSTASETTISSVSETQSPSETQTQPPETEETQTSATEAPSEAFSFVFDPYSISSEYAALYGDEFVSVYRGLADAFINYETTCPCESEELFSLLFAAVDSCMPYFASDAVLTYESYDVEAKTITIHYRSASKAEHDAAYLGFISAVEGYFAEGIHAEDSDLLKAISLYKNFSSAISYDLNSEDVSAFGALTSRKGIAHGFSTAYAYLLRQAGINANTCGGLSFDGTAAHEWVVFELDGLWFYADPTYESGETGGLGLSYFGTNNAERKDAGYTPEHFRLGATGALWAKDLAADGNHFDFLRGSTAFVIDRANSTLTLSNGVSVNISELPGGSK